MVTTLYLIRHGETEGAETKRYKGSIDVPLSEKGIEQMRQAAEFIYDTEMGRRGDVESYNFTVSPRHRVAASSLTAIYCSPLNRALKSAEIIAEPHGLKPGVIPDLRERNFGVWEGMTFTEIKEKYPEEFESWANNPLKYSPIGGESTIEVRDRVIRALDEILNSAETQKYRSAEGKDSTEEQKCGRADFHVPFQNLNCRVTGHGSRVTCHEDFVLPNFRTNIAVVAHGGVNRIILCYIMRIPLENIFRIEQDFAAVNIIEFHDKYPVVKLLNGGVIG